MPTSTAQENKNKQSKASKRATFDMFLGKKRAQQEVVIKLPDSEDLSMLFKALSTTEYDRLISDNPPTTAQKAEGMIYNESAFGPALLSAVCTEPEMSDKQWREIWSSDDWSKGEMTDLFITAGRLCNRGLDIPKSENG